MPNATATTANKNITPDETMNMSESRSHIVSVKSFPFTLIGSVEAQANVITKSRVVTTHVAVFMRAVGTPFSTLP